MGWLWEKVKGKKETKRPTQVSLGSGKGITFLGIVVIWGNAFTLILRFFRYEVAEKHQDFFQAYKGSSSSPAAGSRLAPIGNDRGTSARTFLKPHRIGHARRSGYGEARTSKAP